MKLKSTIRTKEQTGIAMMVAMLALLLLAAIGMGLMFMADTENSINNNYRDAQKAYFAARAGAENVRVLLAPGGTLNAVANGLSMPSPTVPAGVAYVENPTSGEQVNPTTSYVDTELCQEQFSNFVAAGMTATAGPCPAPASTSYFFSPAVTSTDVPGLNGADALAFKWVRLTNKQNLMGLVRQVDPMTGAFTFQSVDGTANTSADASAGQQVCWNGTTEITIPAGQTCAAQTPLANPVWLLTSLAVTPKIGQNPGSRRMVQMEVALSPPIMPPGTISAKAPVTLQGSFSLNSYDSCSCTCTTTKGVTTCNNPPDPRCDQTHHAVFTENTVSQIGNSGQTVTPFGTDPTVSPVSIMSVPDAKWPYNIDDLINQFKQTSVSPGYTCTGTQSFYTIPPSYLNCGTQSNQQFGTFPSTLLLNPPVEPLTPPASVTEYVPGSVHLTAGANGSGVLVVDGDLDINGGLNWYGLILVRGKVTFSGGAGSSVNLFGSILAGEDITAVNQSQASVDGDTFGGSINFHYDTCALKNTGGTRPPRLLATHELSY